MTSAWYLHAGNFEKVTFLFYVHIYFVLRLWDVFGDVTDAIFTNSKSVFKWNRVRFLSPSDNHCILYSCNIQAVACLRVWKKVVLSLNSVVRKKLLVTYFRDLPPFILTAKANVYLTYFKQGCKNTKYALFLIWRKTVTFHEPMSFLWVIDANPVSVQLLILGAYWI